MEIIIDSSEPQKMFDALERLSYERKFSIVRKDLITGDFICGNIVIERKEAGDFISSISGRLPEQFNKMSLNFEHKYLIIEGSLWNVDSRMNPRSIIGMQASGAVRHNIKIINTPNVDGTAWAIYSIINKHIDGKTFNPDTPILAKRVANKEDILVNMISSIPGIGYEKATAIAKYFDYNFEQFYSSLKEVEPFKEISGIGKIITDKIKEAILNQKI